MLPPSGVRLLLSDSSELQHNRSLSSVNITPIYYEIVCLKYALPNKRFTKPIKFVSVAVNQIVVQTNICAGGRPASSLLNERIQFDVGTLNCTCDDHHNGYIQSYYF